jgi:hypothetical protein
VAVVHAAIAVSIMPTLYQLGCFYAPVVTPRR